MLRFELDPPVDQTIRLVTDASSAPDLWETWGPSLITGGVSLLVALIALGGVLLSASKNRSAMIEAENLRAERALAAEGLRHANAIDAENIRAAKAIAAEDRRHENTLRQEEIAWTRGAKTRAYFGLIDAMNQLAEGMVNRISYMRPNVGANDEKRKEMARESLDNWNKAASDVRHRIAEIEAIGDPDIAQTALRALAASRKAMARAREARVTSPQAPHDSREADRDFQKEALTLANEMRAAIRAELAPIKDPARALGEDSTAVETS